MNTLRLSRWMWLPVVASILYAAAVMGMRWQEKRNFEENERQRTAEANRQIVERYGNGELKLLTFYANPAKVTAGGVSLLCYGVANANSVSIEPDVRGVSPSLSRCVEVHPTKDTTYTLTASGRSGEKVSQAVSIDVR